jgi:hypothetical protein
VPSARSETRIKDLDSSTYCGKGGDFIANLLQENGKLVEVQLVVGIRIVKIEQGANLERSHERRRSMDFASTYFLEVIRSHGYFLLDPLDWSRSVSIQSVSRDSGSPMIFHSSKSIFPS